MKNIKYYIPGSLFVLMGLLIVAVPQILVVLIAASIIMAGIAILQIGHMMRKSGTEIENIVDRFSDDDFFGRRFARVPVYRNRYRSF